MDSDPVSNTIKRKSAAAKQIITEGTPTMKIKLVPGEHGTERTDTSFSGTNKRLWRQQNTAARDEAALAAKSLKIAPS